MIEMWRYIASGFHYQYYLFSESCRISRNLKPYVTVRGCFPCLNDLKQIISPLATALVPLHSCRPARLHLHVHRNFKTHFEINHEPRARPFISDSNHRNSLQDCLFCFRYRL